MKGVCSNSYIAVSAGIKEKDLIPKATRYYSVIIIIV